MKVLDSFIVRSLDSGENFRKNLLFYLNLKVPIQILIYNFKNYKDVDQS